MGPTASSRARNALPSACAIALGIMITLVVRGYQFGHSNHTVYLLDALRVNDPRLLANDWFTTHTLQYHVVFTHVTAWLDRLGIVRPAYLAGYLALVVLLHVAWFSIVRALGGSPRLYLLSVMLFFLSAGGIGLGMYDFLQDSSFLPSNVANVAILWGIYFWITARPGRSGLMLGIAGFFHLNHALVGIGMWVALIAWDRVASTQRTSRAPGQRGTIAGTAALLALCLPNVLPAARASLVATGKLPLQDFVNVYVRLRHPHHYDPSTWPVALWISFLWPMPLAVLAARRAQVSMPLRQLARVFLLYCAILAVALVFAGIWYVSEPLIQMSLFRFSIYPKLLGCIGAASVLYGGRNRPAMTYLTVGIAAVAVVARIGIRPWPQVALDNIPTLVFLLLLFSLCAMYELVVDLKDRRKLVLFVIPVFALGVTLVEARRSGTHLFGFQFFLPALEREDYQSVCTFARDHTPMDAVFLVPPQEEAFRLTARRAIVVNFKGVPQLGSELREWRDRLDRVLDWPNGPPLTHRFDRTLEAIGARYDQLPGSHLADVARRYQARYVITERAVDLPSPARLVFEAGRYRLYDLTP